MDKITVFVSGGNGFLASEIIKKLVASNYYVVTIEVDIENLWRLQGVSDFLKVYETADCQLAFKENDIDIVIHTATIYGRAGVNISQLLETNLMLPINLLSLAMESRSKFFINTDSYFNRPNMYYKFLGEYVLSKKHSVEWLRQMSDSFPIVNMKLEHIYGPSDSKEKFVPAILHQLCKGNDFDMTPGDQRRDFIYVTDVADAYMSIIREFDNRSNGFTTIDVGTGISHSIREFVEVAKNLSDQDSKVSFGGLPYRENEIMDSRADTSILKSLGWKPQVLLEDGIRKIIEYNGK